MRDNYLTTLLQIPRSKLYGHANQSCFRTRNMPPSVVKYRLSYKVAEATQLMFLSCTHVTVSGAHGVERGGKLNGAQRAKCIPSYGEFMWEPLTATANCKSHADKPIKKGSFLLGGVIWSNLAISPPLAHLRLQSSRVVLERVLHLHWNGPV